MSTTMIAGLVLAGVNGPEDAWAKTDSGDVVIRIKGPMAVNGSTPFSISVWERLDVNSGIVHRKWMAITLLAAGNKDLPMALTLSPQYSYEGIGVSRMVVTDLSPVRVANMFALVKCAHHWYISRYPKLEMTLYVPALEDAR